MVFRSVKPPLWSTTLWYETARLGFLVEGRERARGREGGADEEEVGSDCDLLELTLRSKQIGGMPSGGALNSAESFRSRSRAPIVAPILTESSAGGFSSMSELL